MISSRRFLCAATATLCLAGALSSCSGDDDKDKSGDSDPSSSSTDSAGNPTGSASNEPQGDVQAKCTANVQVTGAVELSWQGPGKVRKTTTPDSDGPRAVYSSEHDGAHLSLYSTGKNFEASANISSSEAAYTTPPGDATGLDGIDPKGKGATVDVDMIGVAEPGVHVTATFSC